MKGIAARWVMAGVLASGASVAWAGNPFSRGPGDRTTPDITGPTTSTTTAPDQGTGPGIMRYGDTPAISQARQALDRFITAVQAGDATKAHALCVEKSNDHAALDAVCDLEARQGAVSKAMEVHFRRNVTYRHLLDSNLKDANGLATLDEKTVILGDERCPVVVRKVKDQWLVDMTALNEIERFSEQAGYLHAKANLYANWISALESGRYRGEAPAAQALSTAESDLDSRVSRDMDQLRLQKERRIYAAAKGKWTVIFRGHPPVNLTITIDEDRFTVDGSPEYTARSAPLKLRWGGDSRNDHMTFGNLYAIVPAAGAAPKRCWQLLAVPECGILYCKEYTSEDLWIGMGGVAVSPDMAKTLRAAGSDCPAMQPQVTYETINLRNARGTEAVPIAEQDAAGAACDEFFDALRKKDLAAVHRLCIEEPADQDVIDAWMAAASEEAACDRNFEAAYHRPAYAMGRFWLFRPPVSRSKFFFFRINDALTGVAEGMFFTRTPDGWKINLPLTNSMVMLRQQVPFIRKVAENLAQRADAIAKGAYPEREDADRAMQGAVNEAEEALHDTFNKMLDTSREVTQRQLQGRWEVRLEQLNPPKIFITFSHEKVTVEGPAEMAGSTSLSATASLFTASFDVPTGAPLAGRQWNLQLFPDTYVARGYTYVHSHTVSGAEMVDFTATLVGPHPTIAPPATASAPVATTRPIANAEAVTPSAEQTRGLSKDFSAFIAALDKADAAAARKYATETPDTHGMLDLLAQSRGAVAAYNRKLADTFKSTPPVTIALAVDLMIPAPEHWKFFKDGNGLLAYPDSTDAIVVFRQIQGTWKADLAGWEARSGVLEYSDVLKAVAGALRQEQDKLESGIYLNATSAKAACDRALQQAMGKFPDSASRATSAINLASQNACQGRWNLTVDSKPAIQCTLTITGGSATIEGPADLAGSGTITPRARDGAEFDITSGKIAHHYTLCFIPESGIVSGNCAKGAGSRSTDAMRVDGVRNVSGK